MGLGFTIDTPVHVARFGISSVISIVEDGLIEEMRKHHAPLNNEEYIAIETSDEDYRAKRITAYLNLINRIVQKQAAELKLLPFEEGNDITKYFELLPDTSPVKALYNEMLASKDEAAKLALQQELRSKIETGAIDVNIMVKLDRTTYTKSGEARPKEFCDAMAALRGFALSDLHSSVVFSAGYNPQLYAYSSQFNDFFPDENGYLKKKVIIKVSDYRSALTQGKIFAKKGIWVSEFRIESGLNCGGHAFATEGLLLGPILEEFKKNKVSLGAELLAMCKTALDAKSLNTANWHPETRVTVQGGIGTANENNFLFDYYEADGTGWGSPFLLVPEVTNVDKYTLQQLATAEKDDYYLSNASPLGVPFNNFKKASSHQLIVERVEKGRPGSPCYKKFLVSNTEFTEKPICTSSREYLNLKIKQLQAKGLPTDVYNEEFNNLIEKDCLCEGLGAGALLKVDVMPAHKLDKVSICPGPNLAYFSGIFSMKQMVDHIYGRTNLLNSLKRSNMFVNELELYVNYLKNEISKTKGVVTNANARYLKSFQSNLLQGISYYHELTSAIKHESEKYLNEMKEELTAFENKVKAAIIPLPSVVTAPVQVAAV